MGTPGRTPSQQPASSIKSVALPVARCLPETAQTISHIVRTPPNDTINHAGYARRHITLRPERTSRRRARPTPYTFTFTFMLMPHVSTRYGRAFGPDIPARLRSESTRASQLEAGRMLSVYSGYFGFVGAVNDLGRGGPHQPSERPRAIFKCMSHHRRSTERAGLKRKMQSSVRNNPSRTFHGLCLHPAPITKPQMV